MNKENQGVKLMRHVTQGSVGMDVHYVFIITVRSYLQMYAFCCVSMTLFLVLL